MAATFEEMSAWTADEIQAQIYAVLPSTVLFYFGLDEKSGVWAARFDRVDKSGAITTLWEDSGFEKRILLFNAYGWVWLQRAPKPEPTSAWLRRREITAKAVTDRVNHGTSPDPEDLDPGEVDSVYSKSRTGQ